MQVGNLGNVYHFVKGDWKMMGGTGGFPEATLLTQQLKDEQNASTVATT